MAFFRSYFKSNSKIISLYFLGTFLLLLVITIMQQGWYLFNDTDLYKNYFQSEEQFDHPINENKHAVDNISLEKNIESDSFQYITSQGDTLSSIFSLSGMDQKNIYIISKLVSSIIDLKKIKIGTHIKIVFVDKKCCKPEEVIISLANNKKIIVNKDNDDNYLVSTKDVKLIKKTEKLSSVIVSSFLGATQKLNISNQSKQELIKALSYLVDFQKDIKNGNKIEILVDNFYTEEGKFDHTGPVLYSKLSLNNKIVEIFLFKDNEGNVNYYNIDGVSIRKDFLSRPIKTTRISSGFGMRKHPVLGFPRMHKGVDYPAPLGTPVFAAGNGVVTIIGRKGGYGNYIKIKHNNTYSTAYAHLNRFAKNLKKGSKVKQGEVIAYVGATGISSGPHLHFEVIKFDQHIDPKTVKASPEVKLVGKNLYNFNMQKKKILLQKEEL